MSNIGFELRFDEALNALVVVAHGLWDKDVLDRFKAAMFAKITELRARTRGWDVFVDATDSPVHSPTVVADLEILFTTGRANNTGYTAILISSTLAKLQMQRAVGHERLRVFYDRDEAVIWMKSNRAKLEAS